MLLLSLKFNTNIKPLKEKLQNNDKNDNTL